LTQAYTAAYTAASLEVDMANIELSNPQAAERKSVSFTATRDGVAHSFMVGREALEDVEYQELTTNDALLEAFGRQQELIAMCAGKALDSGATGKSVVELQSLLT
jgi:hypothetical protein